MRKLILARGIPGCGKSTFIREKGLELYMLSPDSLRSNFASPVYEAAGGMRLPAEIDRDVWKLLLELLERRMFRGELMVLDATHAHPRSFSNYQQLARKHRYQVLCLDFSDVPFEVCQERNQLREPASVVPPMEMQRMYDNLQRSKIPNWITRVTPEDIETVLSPQPKDVSQYKRINHIGDLQGCFDPLQQYFETYGFHDDELYIFCGDYLDRGTQNAKVMEWLLDNYRRENIVFIEGNHEGHLRNWANGRPARSKEFELRTKPQLEAAGLTPKKVYGFLYKLRESFFYAHHGRTVLVTHGGIGALPSRLSLIASQQLVRGVGAYEEADVADATFAAVAPDSTYQVHGHRNRYSSPTQVNERCFNLEGKVEFGGALRTVSLDERGFTERSIISTIDSTNDIVEPVGDLPAKAYSVDSLIGDMRASNSIYEKPQDGTHISSFNFKRDVFYNKSWDALNVHARGLFINTERGAIVARSYEKFFNVGERPETQPDVLVKSLKFPVKAWVKENGYLGLIGYDPETDGLVFASKSSLTSEFAGWLQEQFKQSVDSSNAREQIKQYVKSDGGKTLVFEVIEPQRDPHIIRYDVPRLVLLDIVNNQPTFETASTKERERVASILGCELKKLAANLKNTAEFEGWLQTVQRYDYLHQGGNIEGFVIEDTDGFMVKIKLPWYGFWRQMRTQLQRLQAGKKPQLPAIDIQNRLAEKFIAFLSTKSVTELNEANIVSLRDEFEDRVREQADITSN